MQGQLTPDRILELGFAFWGAKTLLSAVELGVFSELAKGTQDGEALRMARHCASGSTYTRVARGTSSTRSWPWAC
jgi:hypothetical protein